MAKKNKELMKNILKKTKALVKANKRKPVMVLSEGWDERGLKATQYVVKKKIAKMILLDQGGKIAPAAAQFGVDISGCEIIDIKDGKNDALKKELADVLFKAREKKGMTPEQAAKLIEDENYFSCCMVLAGKADALLGSLIRPTGDLMKPALQLLRKDLVSEIMVIYDPRRDAIFFGTDASLNISPDAAQLAQMGINMAKVAKMFDYDPIVGVLSFSTKGSGGDTPETLFAREAIKKAKELQPDLKIGGEFQFDAAVNPDAAKRKCADDEFGGKVNCFLFPNLTTSNVFCHGMGQFSDMNFMFTLMMGMIKPATILGRSTSIEQVQQMFVVTALEALEMK